PTLDDAARDLLRQSIDDLRHFAELRELGMALFLDRPLGAFKRPGEPDQTPLLSYEAFSSSIARERLRYLHEELRLFIDETEFGRCLERLPDLPGKAVPVPM